MTRCETCKGEGGNCNVCQGMGYLTKGREQKILAFRKKLAEKIERKKRTSVAIPPPVYDEVYFQGTAWLDAMARGEVEEVFPEMPACGEEESPEIPQDLSTQLFNQFDDLIEEENFEECDRLLSELDVTSLEIQPLICVLASTLCAADRLLQRTDFRSRAEERIKALAADRVEKLMRNL